MYFLLKMGILQPAMLVYRSEFGEIIHFLRYLTPYLVKELISYLTPKVPVSYNLD